MKRASVKCGHHWFWQLGDGRRKCRRCGQRQSFRSAWDSARLGEATKRRLLEYFVLGVPAYRLRFRSPVTLEATERFFRLCRRVLAVAEECQQPVAGRVECDEALFGGRRKGKRGRGAAGEVLVFGILERNGPVWRLRLPKLIKLIGAQRPMRVISVPSANFRYLNRLRLCPQNLACLK